jgi:isopentenyldiphosphate isomerase
MHNELHSGGELLKVVDPATGELTGEAFPRAEVFSRNLWVRTTNVYLINSKGEVLCHQRALDKDSHPGVWITHFGGHVAGEETYEEGAQKELHEEAGLDIPVEKLLPWRTSRKSSVRRWMRDFVTLYDGPAESLQFQKEEIEQVQWLSATEILERLDAEDIDTPENWLAGTHNFKSDYQCMRAVLTTAFHLDIFGPEYHHLANWAPAKKVYSL